jgi:hypothetical protein
MYIQNYLLSRNNQRLERSSLYANKSFIKIVHENQNGNAPLIRNQQYTNITLPLNDLKYLFSLIVHIIIPTAQISRSSRTIKHTTYTPLQCKIYDYTDYGQLHTRIT